jgi:hypothetical protein
MAYSKQTIQAVSKAPKTLGNQLGRWAIHLEFPVTKVAELTGATRQSVYNWFNGGEVFVAYRPVVKSLISIFQTCTTADEAWRKACKALTQKT